MSGKERIEEHEYLCGECGGMFVSEILPEDVLEVVCPYCGVKDAEWMGEVEGDEDERCR